MADEQVGTVSVKVLPDTKGFRQKLKAELEKIERNLNLTIEVGLELSQKDLAAARAQLKKLGSDAKVKIGTTLDSSTLDDAVKAALARAQAMADQNDLSAKLDHVDIDLGEFRERLHRMVDEATSGLKAEIPADLWDEGIRAKLDRLLRELNAMGDVEVGVDIDDADFRARYERLVAQIQEETARIRVDLNAERMRRQYEDLINQMKGRTIDLPITLENMAEAASRAEELARDRHMTVTARVDAARAFAEIAVLARDRTINFTAEFRDSKVGSMAGVLAGLSGARTIRNLSKELTDIIESMDSTLKTVAIFSTGLGTLAGVAMSTAGAVLTLGKGVVDLGRGGLVLPAVFAAAATTMGILTIAISSAQDYIPGVVSDFQSLQSVVAGGFWDRAAPAVNRFNEAFQPLARRTLPALSGALGDMGAAVADSLTQFTKTGGMEKFFKNLTAGYKNGTKGMGSLTDGLLNFVEAGSRFFPAMGRAFTNSMGQFAKWSNRITSDGTFDRWMRTAADSATQFGRIIYHTGGILSGFYRASQAAGGPTMRDLANGFQSVSKAVNSTRGMNFITTMFEGAYQSARNLAPGLRDLGNAIVDLGPYASKSMALAGRAMGTFFSHLGTMISDPRFGSGMVHMFEGFNKGIESLRPVFESLGGDIGMLMSSFGLLAEVLGRVVGTASRELGVLFQDLLRIVDALIPVLGDWLISAIEKIAPAVRGASAAIRDFTEAHPKLAAAVVISATALGALIKVIGLVAGPFAKAYAGVSKLRGLLGGLPKPLSNILRGATDAGGAMGTLGRVVGTAGRSLSRFGGWAALAVGALVGMWNNSDTLRSSVKNLGGALFDLGKGVYDTVAPYFKDFADNTLPGLVDAFSDLEAGVSPILKVLGDTLGGQIDRVADKIRLATPGIKKFSGALANAANQGLKTFSHGVGALGKVMQGDWKGAWEELKKGSEEAAKMFPKGMQDAMDGARNRMVKFIDEDVPFFLSGIKKLPQSVGGVFDDVRTLILTKVSEWFAGMGEAIVTGVATVITFFQNLITTITMIYDQIKMMIVMKVAEWFLGMGTAIMTGIATVVMFFQNLITTITMIYDQIKMMIAMKVAEWFVGMGTAIMTGIATVVMFFQNLITTITMIYDQIKMMIAMKVAEWFLGMGTAIMTGIAMVVMFFQNLITTITMIYDQIKMMIAMKVAEWFVGMGTAILAGIAQVVSFFRNLYNGIMIVMTTIAVQLVSKAVQWFVGMGSAVSNGINNIVSFFRALPGKVMSAIASLAGQLLSAAQRWMQGMGSAVQTGISQVVSFFQSLPGRVMSAIASLAGQLLSAAQQWMQGMGSAVQTGIGQVVGFFQSLPGRVTGALAGMAGQLTAIGAQMMEGLIGGIRSMAGRVAESARSVVAGAVAAARAALRIHSPSRVFRSIGEYTGMGYIKGLDSMAAPVERATTNMLSVPRPVKLPDPKASSSLLNGGAPFQVIVPERTGEDPTRLGRRVGESIAFELAKGADL